MQAAAGERSATSFGGGATLFFDGGSLGNPGKGGAGYQLFADNGRTIKESAVRMNGTSTNNQAEYVGLIHGLTAALHSGVQELTVYGDSEVVIKQMLGQYQVKNPVLIDLHQRAVVLRQQFRRVTLQWIPREKNGGADALSKKAMHQAEAAGEAADWFR
jgi:ribonuclease HI